MVVPHAGTWIEMQYAWGDLANTMSFPTRERGLKLLQFKECLIRQCRSPRGNVD